MEIQKRIEQYKAIEEARGRPLIVYATSTRANASAQMAGDAIREFIDQIDAINSTDAVDVLIHSTGGDGLTAWKLMSVLRSKFDEVGVLVPFQAFSAATIFALGANEIVMHPHASLGPIDPQITVRNSDGTTLQFAYEDVGAFLQFMVEEGKLTEQAYVSSVLEKLLSTVNPLSVGAAKRASDLSSDVGARLLTMHMSSAEEKPRVTDIAKDLNKSFFAHGDAIPRDRARDLGLKIANSDEEMEALIWQAYLGIESFMELRQPYNDLDIFLSDKNAADSLKPLAPLQLPANAPQAVQQQAWNAVAQTAITAAQQAGHEVPYSTVQAVIESPRCASEYRTDGTVGAVRVAGGQIQISKTQLKSCWRAVNISTRATRKKRATTK